MTARSGLLRTRLSVQDVIRGFRMVQLKYFGDCRDFFKYDLITAILENHGIKNYVFVPMLTKHRIDREGEKSPKMIRGKSEALLAFIRNCRSKDLCHWEQWMAQFVENYRTLPPVNGFFFDHENRAEYWIAFKEHLKTKDALIFLDPDTGLERSSFIRSSEREKYILNGEISLLHNHLDPSSILMIYQHLQNNKRLHESDVIRKLEQLKASHENARVCGYREDDLVFLFLSKDENVFRPLCDTLRDYCLKSGHERKSLHLPAAICA
jgi:hypothetical protein